MTRAHRLTDPDEHHHFNYPHDRVRALLDENPPAGPDGDDDDRLRVEDYMSHDVADASAAYTAAQAAYLADPGDATKADYDSTKVALVAARQAHRANRPAGPTVVGIRARRAGE